VASQFPLTPTGVNFSMGIIFNSSAGIEYLTTFLTNISEAIEDSCEDASNHTLEVIRDFEVIAYINKNQSSNPFYQGEAVISSVGKQMYAIMIEVLVICRNDIIKNKLQTIVQGQPFGQYLNQSFYLIFKNLTSFSTFVYSVNNQVIIPGISSTLVPQTTMLPSALNMTSTYMMEPTKATGSITQKAKHFLRKLVPWMIAVIVIAALIFCLLLIGCCACMKRLHDHMSNKQSCADDKNRENLPMINNNQYLGQQTGNQYTDPAVGNQYANKPTRIADEEDDQIYV